MRSQAIKLVLLWLTGLKVRACKNSCFPKCECEGTTMDCSDSLLERLPDSIPFNTTELLLSNNNISNYNETILSELLGNHSFVIRKLALDRNNISVLPENTFQNTPDITELNLDCNKLNVITSDSLSPIKSSLVNLTLRNNELSEIPRFSYGNLRHIDVRENCITSLSRIFSDKNELKTVKVGGQSAECGRQPGFSNRRLVRLDHAEEVDFRGTPDTHSLVFDDDFFEQLPNTLKFLHLQDATVSSINFTTSSLETIHLRNLAAGMLLAGVTDVCTSVKSLYFKDVADIRINGTIVENCALENAIFDNATVILASQWDKMANLSRLAIHEDRNLTELTFNNTRYNFTGIGTLTELNLAFNYITEIEDRFFSPLKRLVELSLDSNDLTKLEPESFANASSLQVLDVSQNSIAELGNRPLELPALRFLNLSHNLIENIPENFFSRNSNLEMVDLTHNRLMDIGLFVNLKVTRLVVLSDFNPWECDRQSLQKYQMIVNKTDVDLVCSYSYKNNRTTKRQLERQELIDEFNEDNKLCVICNTPEIVKGLAFEQAMEILSPLGVTTEQAFNGTSVSTPLPIPLTTYILGVGAGLFVILVVTFVSLCCCYCNKSEPSNRERRQQLRKLSTTISARLGLTEYASIKSSKNESEYQTIHETGYELPMGGFDANRSSTLSSITSSVFRHNVEMPHVPIPKTIASSTDPTTTTDNFGYETPILLAGNQPRSFTVSSSVYDEDYLIFPEGQTIHRAREITRTEDEAEKKKRNDSATSNLYLTPTKRESPKSPSRGVYMITGTSNKVKFEFDDAAIAKVKFTGETSGQN